MSSKKILIDTASRMCTPPNATALGERLNVARQQISRWKVGHDPMPRGQIIAVAKIAKMDADEWLIRIEAEQADGELRRSYTRILQRMGVAASIALCAIAFAGFAADSSVYDASSFLPMSIMLSLAMVLARFWQAPAATA